jgi:aryl-alcohol dehydrogenase-like predicted oxidoreductase
LTRFDCIQSPYNLLARDIEVELLPCCASEGVGVTGYHPLAAGLLTGKHDPTKSPASNTRFSINKGYYDRYWSPINFKAVADLKQIADALGQSLAQFSIAWILNNPLISSAIVGASSTRQLEENIEATELNLTAEQIKACDQVWLTLRPPRYFYGR